MAYFIFAGDMLVMAFMMAVAVWVYMKSSRESIEASARIPLEDEAELPEGDAFGREAADG